MKITICRSNSQYFVALFKGAILLRSCFRYDLIFHYHYRCLFVILLTLQSHPSLYATSTATRLAALPTVALIITTSFSIFLSFSLQLATCLLLTTFSWPFWLYHPPIFFFADFFFITAILIFLPCSFCTTTILVFLCRPS